MLVLTTPCAKLSSHLGLNGVRHAFREFWHRTRWHVCTVSTYAVRVIFSALSLSSPRGTSRPWRSFQRPFQIPATASSWGIFSAALEDGSLLPGPIGSAFLPRRWRRMQGNVGRLTMVANLMSAIFCSHQFPRPSSHTCSPCLFLARAVVKPGSALGSMIHAEGRCWAKRWI